MKTVEAPGVLREEKLGERKVENLQALRGIAILWVLLYHIGHYEGRRYGEEALLPAFTFMGRAGVDVFFVVSGFVMVMITRGRFQRPDGTKTFLLRRAARIYPLYWLYTLVYLPAFLWRPDIMNRPEGSQGISLLHSFLLLPYSQAPLLGQGWTLVYELYFYVVFGLILLRPEKDRLRMLLAWSCVIVVGSVLNRFTGFAGESAVLRHGFSLLTLEFVAGCAVALLAEQGIHRFAVPALLCALIAFPSTLLLPSDWERVLLYGLPAMLLVYGAIGVEVCWSYCFPRWLRFLGDISYSLYLTHMIVISALNRTLGNFGGGVLDNLAFIGLAGVGAIAFGAVSHYVVEKPLLRRCYAAIPSLVGMLRIFGTHRLSVARSR